MEKINFHRTKQTVITDVRNGFEIFVNFYTNKKIEKQRGLNAQNALWGDTESSAGAANVLNSAAKVHQNFDLTKENGENLLKNTVLQIG